MSGDDTRGAPTGASNDDRMDTTERGAGRPADDPTEAAAAGATGAVAGSVVGANMGQGTEGSLAGAVVGSIVGADLTDKATGEDEDEKLTPVDFDKLAEFGSGEAEPTIAEQIEDGT